VASLRGMRHTYCDHDTVERIHQQVPDAPVIAKPLYRERLASAVAKVAPS
jgi:hypothetical protein